MKFRPIRLLSQVIGLITLLLFSLWRGGIQASPSPKESDRMVSRLSRQINRALTQHLFNANIGIVVQDLGSHHLLYSKNADHVFTSASTLKLFTATAALIGLGPTFQFSTELRGPLGRTISQKGVFHGDIALVFGGDPTLTHYDISALIAEIKRQGIQRIQGNLYINNTLFSSQVYGPGWMWDELTSCYAAPLSSVIMDKNCFDVTLVPSTVVGEVKARIDDDQHLISLINTVKTQKNNAHCSINVKASYLNTYHIDGCALASDLPQTVSVAIKNPGRYVKRWLKQRMEAEQINLRGRIILGAPPKPLRQVLAQHKSAPLHELIKMMLKDSDNLIAEAIFKELGAQYFRRGHITWAEGSQAVRVALSQKTGIDFERLNIVDGSGLSRYNLVRPSQVAKLLTYIYHTPALYRYIFPALPVAGVDGTLKHRLREQQAISRQIHAKSGSMTSVSSLAGYVRTLSGQHLAFVIEINGFTEKIHRYKALEDVICLELARLR